MMELWLNFKNENGLLKRVLVEGQKFTVGRTSDNDLCVPFPELSRRHIQIERVNDSFIVSDVGSSNGTTLDEIELLEPTELRNGQRLNLGGGLEIKVEIVAGNAANASNLAGASADIPAPEPANTSASTASVSSVAGASASSDGSIPFIFFIIAPLLVFVVLGIVGVILFVANSGNGSDTAGKNGDFIYSSPTPADDADEDDSDLPKNENKKAAPTPTPAANSGNSSSNGTDTPGSIEIPATPKPSSDTDKIERASVSFLRRIAGGASSNEFLTVKQISVVSPKINQFKNSSALAENLKNAKRNSSKIEEIARSKSLRPQFVATAALAQLGNRQGDVAQTAQGMIDVLGKLRGTFGNELADENLLLIAFYDQGVADKVIASRDMLTGLADKFPQTEPRKIRTIWFLRENGKLSDSQFEFALRFLAIGIIAQNPADFNVQAEAVIFN